MTEQVPTRSRFGRDIVALTVLALVLAAAAAARLIIGERVPINAGGAIDWDLLHTYLALRRDRLIMGATVGVALGVSGTLLQALLRNPLASPYILGVSSGAALGVMTAWTGVLAALGPMATHSAALAGALITMIVVYTLGQRRGWIDPVGLLLVGVIVNAINGAAIMFLHTVVPAARRSGIFDWMMGYLADGTSSSEVVTLGVLTLTGVAIAITFGRSLDVATLSDAEAQSLGLNLRRLRLVVFILAGLLTAMSVALAGPIGFVGLIAPHLVRLMVGPRHRPVIIGSALAGAALVVGADTAVKALEMALREWGGVEIGLLPIGAVTALIGGPLFIAMLRPQLGRGRVEA
ncbi:MAG: iron chelate uptake ABC transporter family permease subunit [Phycisphaera sp.]|nr:iron chelate uptake ABC transporter family permease subunit [Phycisphaera sp.]